MSSLDEALEVHKTAHLPHPAHRHAVEPEPQPEPKERAKPTPNGTRLSKAIEEAANLLWELRRVENRPRLSAGAFLAEQERLCGHPDEAKVAKLDALLREGRSELSEVAWFVGHITKTYREPNFSQPADPMKLLRCYGRRDLPATLTAMGFSVAEAVVLACKRATSDADRFGTFNSIEEMNEGPVQIQAELRKVYARMRNICTLEDLYIRPEGDDGLARVSFQKYPFVSLLDPNWPEKLAEASLAHDPKHPQPPLSDTTDTDEEDTEDEA